MESYFRCYSAEFALGLKTIKWFILLCELSFVESSIQVERLPVENEPRRRRWWLLSLTLTISTALRAFLFECRVLFSPLPYAFWCGSFEPEETFVRGSNFLLYIFLRSYHYLRSQADFQGILLFWIQFPLLNYVRVSP